MEQNWEIEYLEQLNEWVRSGKMELAWSRLRNLERSQISPQFLSDFANIARRLQQPLFGLKLMRTVIRNHIEKKKKASSEEILVYCHCLLKLGIIRETQQWLKEVDGEKYPEVYDIQARAQVYQWNYKEAAPLFKKYLVHIDSDSYAYLVGSLNLAAAYLASGQIRATRIRIKSTIRLARKSKSHLILGNCYELLAQSYVEEKDYEKATESLKRGQKIMGDNVNFWSFLMKKWEFIIRSLDEGLTPQLQLMSDQLLIEAKNKAYWEEVREIERHKSTVCGDDEKLIKIYFGTRFKSYKRRLLKYHSNDLKVPSSYEVTLFGDSDQAPFVDYENIFADNPLLEKLFAALISDFYRPIPLGYLFDSIYDEAYFDPDHSPDRVYALVKRLRKKLKDFGEINIQWGGSFARLESRSPIRIRVNKNAINKSSEDRLLVRIRGQFKRNWFTMKQAVDLVGTSKSSMHRLIQSLAENSKIEKSGMGRSTRYRFL